MTEESGTCRTCKFWDEYGQCTVDYDPEADYFEPPITEPDFGCTAHEVGAKS